MKIAILIAGEYREFALAHKFWSFLKWPNVDTYFATWDTSIFVPWNKQKPNVQESITSKSITAFISVKDMNIMPSPPDIMQNISHKMITCWQSAITLMMKSGIKYDRVILIRPDLALDYSEQEFRTFVETLPENDNSLYGIIGGILNVPFPLEQVRKVSDLMLVGTYVAISKLLTLSKPVGLDIHGYLAENFLQKGINLMNLPIPRQCVVRSTSRGAIDPTFHECKLKAKEWWERRHVRFFDMSENVFDPNTRPIVEKETRNLNSINLWDKYDYFVWPECYQSMPWKSPDTEEYYDKRSNDPQYAHHFTYGKTDIDYCYNSMGFRTPSLGPKEFKDATDYTKLLVGGCSVTEGIGMPEHHLWHNFLADHLYDHSKRPIAKFNMGKGGISVASAIRYAYVAIQHYGFKPDLVHFCLPPVSRKELLLLDDSNKPMINPHLPSTAPTDRSPRSVTAMYEMLIKNINYRQYYHDAFKDLLVFKWLCEAKDIPWFFNFWHNDFASYVMMGSVDEPHHTIDYDIPDELKPHYVPVWQREKGSEAPFPQTIARDYMHSGPNMHFDLAKQLYDSLMQNPTFIEVMQNWRNNGYN